MTEELLSITEASRRLDVPRTVLSRRVRTGRIPAYVDPRDGRKTLIRLADLDVFRPDRPLQRKEVAAA